MTSTPSLATSLGPPAADWSPPTPPGREDTGVANNNNAKTTKKDIIFWFTENISTPYDIATLLDPINVISLS